MIRTLSPYFASMVLIVLFVLSFNASSNRLGNSDQMTRLITAIQTGQQANS